MNDQIETVECIVIRETYLAYFLRERNEHGRDPGRAAYFPKSQVSFKRRNIKTGAATAEIPLWILTEKGWNE
jgi:hypothetical protein